jgi:hypothetical protein
MEVASMGTVGIADVRRVRQRQMVDRLDYLRGLRALAGSMSQRELAEAVGVTQPAISQSLGVAARVAPVVAGFSGADPYEVCQRYAAGELTREQVVDELVRFPYADAPGTVGYDAYLPDAPGSFEDVVRAFEDGLIDEPVYLAAVDANPHPGATSPA